MGPGRQAVCAAARLPQRTMEEKMPSSPWGSWRGCGSYRSLRGQPEASRVSSLLPSSPPKALGQLLWEGLLPWLPGLMWLMGRWVSGKPSSKSHC